MNYSALTLRCTSKLILSAVRPLGLSGPARRPLPLPRFRGPGMPYVSPHPQSALHPSFVHPRPCEEASDPVAPRQEDLTGIRIRHPIHLPGKAQVWQIVRQFGTKAPRTILARVAIRAKSKPLRTRKDRIVSPVPHRPPAPDNGMPRDGSPARPGRLGWCQEALIQVCDHRTEPQS